MVSTFETALELEKALAQLLKTEVETNPLLAPALTLQAECQAQWQAVLKQAAEATEAFPTYPVVEPEQVLVSETQWMAVLEQMKAAGLPDAQLLRLSALVGAYSLLVDYYRQAQSNEPHPTTKLFLSSCIEMKRLQKAAVEKLYRQAVHAVWNKVGFSPVLN